MPLDEVGRRYATNLYNDKSEELRKQHAKRRADITADFLRRNVQRSGFYFSAIAREDAQHIEELANAMADSKLAAYEHSRLPIDDQAVMDISGEADAFCDAQGKNIAANIRQQLEREGLPVAAADSIGAQVERLMVGAKAGIHRKLELLRDEQLMAKRRQASVTTPERTPPLNLIVPAQHKTLVSKETKLGYGFLLAGVGLPYLVQTLFGTKLALIAAALCLIVGVCFLIAGYLHERGGLAWKIIAVVLAVSVVSPGIAWRMHRHKLSPVTSQQQKTTLTPQTQTPVATRTTAPTHSNQQRPQTTDSMSADVPDRHITAAQKKAILTVLALYPTSRIGITAPSDVAERNEYAGELESVFREAGWTPIREVVRVEPQIEHAGVMLVVHGQSNMPDLRSLRLAFEAAKIPHSDLRIGVMDYSFYRDPLSTDTPVLYVGPRVEPEKPKPRF